MKWTTLCILIGFLFPTLNILRGRNFVACKHHRLSKNNLNSLSLPFLLAALQPVISNYMLFYPSFFSGSGSVDRQCCLQSNLNRWRSDLHPKAPSPVWKRQALLEQAMHAAAVSEQIPLFLPSLV